MLYEVITAFRRHFAAEPDFLNPAFHVKTRLLPVLPFGPDTVKSVFHFFEAKLETVHLLFRRNPEHGQFFRRTAPVRKVFQRLLKIFFRFVKFVRLALIPVFQITITPDISNGLMQGLV